IRTSWAIGMPGGIDSVTIDSNIMTGDTCVRGCGWAPSFLYTFWKVTNTKITNNWIDGVYQGISLGGPGEKSSGSNNQIDNNTIIHLIRMGLEFGTPLND